MSTNGDSLVQNNGDSTKLVGGVTGKGFMPGQSGNPGGRPKRLSTMLDRLLADKKKNYPEKLVTAAINRAIKRSDKALEMIWERHEGSEDEKANVSFHVTIDIPFPQKDE